MDNQSDDSSIEKAKIMVKIARYYANIYRLNFVNLEFNPSQFVIPGVEFSIKYIF